MATTNLAGKVTKKVVATTNDAENRRVILTLSGKVLVPFTRTPRYVRFTEVPEFGTPMPITVTLKRGDGDPIDLQLIELGKVGGGETPIDCELVEIEAGEHYELHVTLQPPARPGRLRSWIRLKTGVEEVRQATVPVFATIPATWRAVAAQ